MTRRADVINSNTETTNEVLELLYKHAYAPLLKDHKVADTDAYGLVRRLHLFDSVFQYYDLVPDRFILA